MRVIKLNDEGLVIQIRNNANVIYDGEFESEFGEIGQLMLNDGSFVTHETEQIEPEPTIEEQILSENQYQTALLEMQLLGGM